MFFDSEAIKEHVVLGTDAKTPSNLVHLRQDAVSIDNGITRGGCVEASEYGHGSGLPCSIVPQESSDVIFVHVEGDVLHCHLGLLWLGW